MIDQLTPEQAALIPVYREKWRAIALSTERIDRQKAAQSLQEAYRVSGLVEPEILFAPSPDDALDQVLRHPSYSPFFLSS